MDRGGWWAAVHQAAESDTNEPLRMVHKAPKGEQVGFDDGSILKQNQRIC